MSELSLVMDRRSFRCKGPGVRRSSQGNENKVRACKAQKVRGTGVSQGYRAGRATQNCKAWSFGLFQDQDN